MRTTRRNQKSTTGVLFCRVAVGGSCTVVCSASPAITAGGIHLETSGVRDGPSAPGGEDTGKYQDRSVRFDPSNEPKEEIKRVNPGISCLQQMASRRTFVAQRRYRTSATTHPEASRPTTVPPCHRSFRTAAFRNFRRLVEKFHTRTNSNGMVFWQAKTRSPPREVCVFRPQPAVCGGIGRTPPWSPERQRTFRELA